MRFLTKNKILIFLVVILFVSNLTTIIALVIHKREFHYLPAKDDCIQTTVINNGRLFKDSLNLNSEQNSIFRDLRREYNLKARGLSFQMQDERMKMIDELSKENPDTIILNEISVSIGEMHSELKRMTIKYFLDMKKECNTKQQEKLSDIFKNLLNSNGEVNLPGTGQGKGRRQNRFNR